jgi:DNA-binding transcriptional LysR family regulator
MKDTDWEILYELYKNPNMTQVANLLFITQPALTKRIHIMEEEFDVKILNRLSKGLSFTKEGEFLAHQADVYMKFLDRTRETLKKYSKELNNIITIGASYTYSKYQLTELLSKYAKECDGVKFDIINASSDELFRMVLEGKADVVFIRGDYKGPIEKKLVSKNQAYLLCKEEASLEQLPMMQRIEYNSNEKTKEIISSWWKDNYEEKEPSGMEVGYVDFAEQIIAKDLGYMLCFLPNEYANTHQLHLKPLFYKNGQPVIRNTWFAYNTKSINSQVLKDFVNYVNQTITSDSLED